MFDWIHNLKKGIRAKVTSRDSTCISINGHEYRGRSVSIINNRVIIDGVEADSHPDDKEINIVVNASVIEECYAVSGTITCTAEHVKSVSNNSGSIEITGSATEVSTNSGSVSVGEDVDSVDTNSGDVTAKSVRDFDSNSGKLRVKS